MLHAVITERDEARAALEECQGREFRRELNQAQQAGLIDIPGATICIPYYKQPEWLPRALDSALAQTAGLVEVIVVDDGSPDSVARDLCASRAAEGAPIRYVRVTNRGLPNARNTGLMLAKGQGFVPLDSDDWLEPTFLEKTLPLLAEYDIVLTGLQEHGPVRNGTYPPGFRRPLSQITVETQLEMNCLWYCALMKISMLREAGGWNGRMTRAFEDWDLSVDLLKRGARLGEVKEVLFNYSTTNPESMLVSLSQAERKELEREIRMRHT